MERGRLARLTIPASAERIGWRSRGYLPHLDTPDLVQHVVFRLSTAFRQSCEMKLQSFPPRIVFRPSDQLAAAGAYIEHNPVKAGLCADPTDWCYSSVSYR